jgi:hypothetical protein
VKTTDLSEPSGQALRLGETRAARDQRRKSTIYFADYAEEGYYKHLDHLSRWRLRKAIEQGLWSAIRLGDKRLESLGRCVVPRARIWEPRGQRSCE